ncbi:Pyridoxal 5'-phosphate synthase subunit PdxT [uncultured archaeon]|nr:Pyridoxal 5'-phosphate synthase subunit PdxT [uncultured archaeon]
MVLVGVLALQGDFREHLALLKEKFIPAIEVRSIADLQKCTCLIIPGGESTTIAKLLETSGLAKEIKKRVSKGMPFYGTCAGAILAAKKVAGEKRFRPLGLIDIEIGRNAYGRQVDSFETGLDVKGHGRLNGIFIRAPVIRKIGKEVEVLAEFEGHPVLVCEGNVLVGTFHPETEKNFFMHKMLLGMDM